MIRQHHILASKEQLETFCKKHFIGRLSLFGSILRDDFKPESDVDVLVEFQPGHKIGLLKMARMEAELSEILKRKVDLRTPADLSRYFRQEVVQNAEVQYAQG
jgi:predicted nucleotidyltransferase